MCGGVPPFGWRQAVDGRVPAFLSNTLALPCHPYKDKHKGKYIDKDKSVSPFGWRQAFDGGVFGIPLPSHLVQVTTIIKTKTKTKVWSPLMSPRVSNQCHWCRPVTAVGMC